MTLQSTIDFDVVTYSMLIYRYLKAAGLTSDPEMIPLFIKLDLPTLFQHLTGSLLFSGVYMCSLQFYAPVD